MSLEDILCDCDCDSSPDVELAILFGVIDPALGELERGGPIKIPSGTILLFLIFSFFSFGVVGREEDE